jgi:GAF domain-containing protein
MHRRPFLSASRISHADLSLISVAAASIKPTHSVPFLIDQVAEHLLGHRMLTVMKLHSETMELERVYSSRPLEYPTGGRKSKSGLPWAKLVLEAGQVFIGTDQDDLRWAFDDHVKLIELGLGSVINTPIILSGRCLGTLNLLHEANWYRNGDAEFTRVLAYLLIPVLLSMP